MTTYEIRPPKRTDPAASQPSKTVPARAAGTGFSQPFAPAPHQCVSEAYDDARDVVLVTLETVRRTIHSSNALTVALAGGLL